MEVVEMNWKILVLFLVVGVAGAEEADNWIQNSLKHFVRTEIGKAVFKTGTDEEWTVLDTIAFCTACETVTNQLLLTRDPDAIANFLSSTCAALELATRDICEALVNANMPILVYIMKNTTGITGNDICFVQFAFRGCKSRNPDRIWEVALPDVPKPPIDETPYPQKSDVPTWKVLHLSDTHYDPKYTPGSPAVCEELYLCCRTKGTQLGNESEAAGFWGSYGACDIPKWTLESMFDHISKTHTDIDLIIWTGDIIAHTIRENSKEGNVVLIREMADLISEYFPGTPVAPAIGNHEGHPVDQFSPAYVTEPELSMGWLYNELASIWGRWLPEKAAINVASGGFYSVRISPGLKVLSINTNFCYVLNWWLILDSTDIAEELKFMALELQKSENIDEMVYILGHLPVGSGECSATWSNQFNRIVLRYESTIAGIFYGHTHSDHFQLFLDPEDKDRAYEIGYIGQSQTTYSDLNPGYKIYTVEGDFQDSKYRVLDHDNYILDLTVSNAVNETNFIKLYSAKEEYGLRDLSPASWYDLVLQMNKANSSLFDSFYRNQIKASPPYLSRGCDAGCKRGVLCFLLVSDNSDRSKCDVLSDA